MARLVGAAVAAIVCAALTGAFVAGHYEARLGQMARELAVTRPVYRRLADLLGDPATQVVTLRGVGSSPRATGRMIWSPSAGGELFVASLPPTPRGKAYELWMIGAGPPRPAGVFRVDASGRATHRVEPARGNPPVQAFAVTLEPETGVSAPKGPRVLESVK